MGWWKTYPLLVEQRHLGLAWLALAACSYTAGSYQFVRTDFPRHRATTGCLDVGVGAHETFRPSKPVITYAVGNRCDHDVKVDLRRAEVWGVSPDGVRVQLEPFDPGREMRMLTLGPAWAGRSSIEYPAAGEFTNVCVVLDAMLGARHQPMCLATKESP